MKQRVEAVPPQARVAALAEVPLAQQPGVVEVVPGKVTVTDRLKGYYHTVFAAITLLVAVVVEFGPDIGAIPGLPEKWRHGIAIAVLFANLVATRLKSNEQWFPAPPWAEPTGKHAEAQQR